MSTHQALQSSGALVEQSPRGEHGPHRPPQLAGWLTVKDITTELRFSTEHACRAWLRRQRLASIRRGRVILVSRRDLDGALRRV